MDQNTCFAYLNMELPDDIRRLKEAGYYDAAIARIDACLAEDWTASQNQPLHPQGALPVNPTPHGVDAWRQGLLAHREILRRLPRDYTLTADQLLNKLVVIEFKIYFSHGLLLCSFCVQTGSPLSELVVASVTLTLIILFSFSLSSLACRFCMYGVRPISWPACLPLVSKRTGIILPRHSLLNFN